MDAAITVLVVLLSLLLVLGIAAYAFRMIRDSLPGDTGPDQSYPNPLNWLNNNSTSNKTSTESDRIRHSSLASRLELLETSALEPREELNPSTLSGSKGQDWA